MNVTQGVLVSGKGTRFILANTEQLHTKIHDMSERIRHLEEALEAFHSQCSTEIHPLLRSEHLGIKSTMGLYGGLQAGADASSTPSENGHDHDANSGQMEVDIHSPNEETQKSLVHQVRLCMLCIMLQLAYLFIPASSRCSKRVQIYYLLKLYD
jgi:hypothetical protein